MFDGFLIVQSDCIVLFEVVYVDVESVCYEFVIFVELECVFEYIYMYWIICFGLWNVCVVGYMVEDMFEIFDWWLWFLVLLLVVVDFCEIVNCYGCFVIECDEEGMLILCFIDLVVFVQVVNNKCIQLLLIGYFIFDMFVVDVWVWGQIKQELLKIGWFVEDFVGYMLGMLYEIEFVEDGWYICLYQQDVVDVFVKDGFGVVVFLCGVGKMIVGVGVMVVIKIMILIFVMNMVFVWQWCDELFKCISLIFEEIGEYFGQVKEVKLVIIVIYQILIVKWKGEYVYFVLLDVFDWGFIVYDEVYLFFVFVFKFIVDLQVWCCIGFIVILVCEDGCEGDVFSLIGFKCFDVFWKQIEVQGFIFFVVCYEVCVDLLLSDWFEYVVVIDDEWYWFVVFVLVKVDVVWELIVKYEGECILVIGQYFDQFELLFEVLNVLQIIGVILVDECEELYCVFWEGDILLFVVFKVVNFLIDLLEVLVVIQVLGLFGLCQEEVQCFGCLLCFKQFGYIVSFYMLVVCDMIDQDYVQNCQCFFVEQGYSYMIMDLDVIVV